MAAAFSERYRDRDGVRLDCRLISEEERPGVDDMGGMMKAELFGIVGVISMQGCGRCLQWLVSLPCWGRWSQVGLSANLRGGACQR